MSDCVGYIGPDSERIYAYLGEAKGIAMLPLGPLRVAVDTRNAADLHVSSTSVTIGMRSSLLPHAHGVEIRWDGRHVVIDADAFEQRRLYWQRVGAGIAFATRVDLLPVEPAAISATAFIAQWCLSMNLSEHSLFEGVERLPAGHRLTIGLDGSSHLGRLTPASAEPTDATGAAAVLQDVLRSYASSYDIVLGLSGGFDSRTLMAAMLGAGVPFRVHTYGTASMPDVRRAVDVARRAGVAMHVTDLSAIEWDVDAVIASMRRTAWQTEASYPGAHALVFDDPDRLGPRSLLVDGGYGALWRGGFGNHLLVRHAKALRDRDAGVVANALMRRPPTLFREDLRTTAIDTCTTLVQQALDAMPVFSARSGRAWVDELFLRWNPRGYVASPQSVYDARLASVMPFLDRRFARAAYGMTADQRANGRLFRHILRGAPAIAGMPYVGKRNEVPAFAAGRPLLAALTSHLTPRYAKTVSIESMCYRLLRPAMLDLAHSAPVAPFDLFDTHAVRSLLQHTPVNGDDAAIAQLLDWFSLSIMSV